MSIEKRVRRLESRYAKQDQQDEENGLASALSTREGRRFMWLFLSSCNAFSTPYTGNAISTAFNCGRQSVGFDLLSKITSKFPELFIQMQQENINVHRTRELESRQLRDAAIADNGDEGDSNYGDDAFD